MSINLLPASLIRRNLVRRRLRQWAVVWGILAIIGSLFMYRQYQAIFELQASADAAVNRVAPLKQIQQDVADAENRMMVLNKELSTIESISTIDRSLPLLAVVGHAAKSSTRQIQVEKLSLVSAFGGTPAKSISGKTSPRKPSSVSVHGVTDSDLSLAEFIDALRASSVFLEVELRSSLQCRLENTVGRQFQVECTLKD